jgi:hypothetical protein
MPCLQWNRQKKECWKRGAVIEYSNSEISKVIDEYIHNQKHREIMKRRYIDGILQENLAEEFNISVRQVQNIIYKNENIIFKHLK